MHYLFLTSEETNIWDKALKQIKKKSLSLEDFEIIFHCNSYFEQIAGIDNNQETTISTLIGLDKKGVYHFIQSTEHISFLQHLPNSYETHVTSFSDHQSLIHFLGDSWTKTQRYILHYLLGESLDEYEDKIFNQMKV